MARRGRFTTHPNRMSGASLDGSVSENCQVNRMPGQSVHGHSQGAATVCHTQACSRHIAPYYDALILQAWRAWLLCLRQSAGRTVDLPFATGSVASATRADDE